MGCACSTFHRYRRPAIHPHASTRLVLARKEHSEGIQVISEPGSSKSESVVHKVSRKRESSPSEPESSAPASAHIRRTRPEDLTFIEQKIGEEELAQNSEHHNKLFMPAAASVRQRRLYGVHSFSCDTDSTLVPSTPILVTNQRVALPNSVHMSRPISRSNENVSSRPVIVHAADEIQVETGRSHKKGIGGGVPNGQDGSDHINDLGAPNGTITERIQQLHRQRMMVDPATLSDTYSEQSNIQLVQTEVHVAWEAVRLRPIMASTGSRPSSCVSSTTSRSDSSMSSLNYNQRPYCSH